MSVRIFLQAALLALVVLSCWLGVIGMLRMREPIQALHYLGLPACVGSPLLAVAVFLATGNSGAAWKTVLIASLLLLANAVVTHAIARAFRTRAIGHWQPRPGDPFEYTPHLSAQRAEPSRQIQPDQQIQRSHKIQPSYRKHDRPAAGDPA